jgi:hypothetical protein
MLTLAALATAALVAGLLAIPVDLKLSAAAGDETYARLRVEWLFGRVGWNLEPGGGSGGPRTMPDWKRLSPLWQEAFRDVAGRFLRRCRRWIGIREIRGRARVGLGDPADTGQVIGILQPLVAATDELPRVDLQLVPDFEAARLEGELQAGIRAVPVGMIPPFVAFLSSRETIRTLWRLRSARL